MPKPTIVPYVDGYFGYEREITLNPMPRFPFADYPTPDTYTREYMRIYRVIPNFYLPHLGIRTSFSNLLTYSEQIDNAAWTKTNATVTANATTAPDGSVSMAKILETVTNGAHQATQAATTANAPTEISVFASAGLGRTFLKVAFTDSAAAVFSVTVDVSSGSIVAKAGTVTPKITNLLNGHVRIALTCTPAAGAGTFAVSIMSSATTSSYAGDTTKGMYVWGAQVLTAVSGIVAPYISTTSATRTVLSPEVDPVDPFAYLVEEGVVTLDNSNIATVTRSYCRIPLQQTVPGSLFVTKPTIPGTFPQVFGAYRLFQPVATVASYDAYAAQTVTSDSGTTSSFYPTGGTYTASFIGSTTSATTYNDSNATLQTNLNALTPVSNRGNCVVTGSYNSSAGFTVTFNSYAAATVATGSLTGGTGSTIFASIVTANGGYTQAISIAIGSIDNAATAVGTGSLTWDAGTTTQTDISQNASNLIAIRVYRGANLTGGTYTLTFYGQTTAAIAYNASAAAILSAINAACSNLLARGSISVTGGFISINGSAGLGIDIKVTPKITAGTYTVTIFGQTTGSIAYNASLSTISTAINALSEVTTKRGGCVVTGAGYDSTSGTIVFSVQFSNPAISIDISSLTPSGCTASVAITDGGIGRVQTIKFAAASAVRTLFALNHGLSTSDSLYVKTDSTYTQLSGTFTLPDASTIVLALTPGSTEATATAITEVGKRVVEGYTPGSVLTRINRVTTFYLPGVSAGITVAADIPEAVYEGDATTLLTAIFAQETAINYQVGELERWRGPDLQRTITTINATQL